MKCFKYFFVFFLVFSVFSNFSSVAITHQDLFERIDPKMWYSSSSLSVSMSGASDDYSGLSESVISAGQAPQSLQEAYLMSDYEKAFTFGAALVDIWKAQQVSTQRRDVVNSLKNKDYREASLKSDELFAWGTRHNVSLLPVDYRRAEYAALEQGDMVKAHCLYTQRAGLYFDETPVAVEEESFFSIFRPLFSYVESVHPLKLGMVGFSALERGYAETALPPLKVFYDAYPGKCTEIQSAIKEVFKRHGRRGSKQFRKRLRGE